MFYNDILVDLHSYIIIIIRHLSALLVTMELQEWLQNCGSKSLEHLSLGYFPKTGRGVKTSKPFKVGDQIMAIPSTVFWTVDAATSDPLLGPALRTVDPPLSIDDMLAVFLLFVKSSSHESRYNGWKLHIENIPKRYTSTIFFSDEDLEVCAGSSLYEITQQLKRQIKEDYLLIYEKLFVKYPKLFSQDVSTLENVST